MKVGAYILLVKLCLCFSANAQVVDSVPIVVKDSMPQQYALLTPAETKKINEKYSFATIGTKGKYKNDALVQSFYNQPSNLSYNLNLEAHNYISNFRKKNETELLRMKSWGSYYLSAMENILIQNGIPKQLVYLAVIETHLDVNLVSWAGAAGMWQFMPETGRMYGLKVGGGYDERFDWNRSTYAACGYLRDLYKQFNDWLLVVAAYNGGPGRVYSAIKRSGSRNFWDLQYHLPTESSNHVKKFIATQYIMDGSTAIATVNAFPKEARRYFNPLEKGGVALDTSKNMTTYTLAGRYNSLIVAKYILLDIASFNILNPNFDTNLAKNESSYNLRLPKDKMDLFKANHLSIMNESLQLFLTLNNAVADTPILTKPVKQKKKKN